MLTTLHHSHLNWYVGELELQGYYIGLLSNELQSLYLSGDEEPSNTFTNVYIFKLDIN